MSAAVAIFMLALTVVLTAPYVRAMLRQEREALSRPPRPALRVTANTVGVLAFLVAAFPVYWMVNSSFLDRNEIRNPVPTWVPFGGDLDNFRTVFAPTSSSTR